MLPDSLAALLKDQLARARLIWSQDRECSLPGVFMPDALDRKYPNGGMQWAWFWVWPAPELSIDPRSGIPRRHHLYEQRLQRAIKQALSLALKNMSSYGWPNRIAGKGNADRDGF